MPYHSFLHLHAIPQLSSPSYHTTAFFTFIPYHSFLHLHAIPQLSKDFEKKLELKESPEKGVYVKDLIQFVAKGPSELNNVLKVEIGGVFQ
jgi:hypothetical protein